jgi:hypothetical protein
MVTALKTAFKLVAALAISRDRTAIPEADRETVPGLAVETTARLVVTPLPLRLVEALLAFLALASLILCLFRFEPLCHHEPSLLETAGVLARSPELEHIVSSPFPPILGITVQSPQSYSLQASSHPVSVQSDIRQVQPDFSSPLNQHEENLFSEAERFICWWQPITASTMFRFVLIVDTVASLATLEAYYQLSKKNDGLLYVDPAAYDRYAWLFLPTLVMSGLGLAYVAVDKSIRTAHPFLVLATGKSNPDALTFDPNSIIAPIAVVQTIRRRQFILSAMAATSVLGAFLMIVASGLFTTVPAQYLQPFESLPSTWFDFQNQHPPLLPDIKEAKEEDKAYNTLIQFHNFSYPTESSRGFAFASTFGAPFPASNTSPKVTILIPAVRVQANCTLHDYKDTVITGPDSKTWEVSTKPPPGCKPAAKYASQESSIELNPSSNIQLREGPFGLEPRSSWIINGSVRFGGPDPYTICGDSTQQIFLVYGNQTANKAHNLIVLHCLPFVEAVDVEATFIYPSMRLDLNSPLQRSSERLGPGTQPTSLTIPFPFPP